MSFITKHTWKGLTVAAAVLLSVGLMTAQTASAATTVTTAGNTTVLLSSNPAGGNTYTTVNTITLTSGVALDFALSATSVVLTAPTGWQFNTAVIPTVTKTGTVVFAAAAAPTTTTFTLNATTGSAIGDTVTIAGLQIQPLTATSQAGFITAATAGGTVNAGFIIPGATGTNTAIIITQAPAGTVASDGTTGTLLTFATRDAAGLPVLGLSVSVTASRGTLSATSLTTPTSSCTTSTGTCTLTFRGNGTTGTANITATTASPNEAIGLYQIQVVAPLTNATGIKFFSNNNSGHVASSIQNIYTSPGVGARIRFQVTGGSTGVNNDLIQATVDKGYIVQGDTSANPTNGNQPGSCSGNNTTASDTSHGPVNIDGTDYDGIVEFTVCAKAGEVGTIKVTAKNLSTTMADATTNVISAGVPNKIETTVTGGSVTAVIKDKDGNEVADGTVVTFKTPSFTGSVAPDCTTTTNGKAAASAAFSGAGGQVLITVFINDSGNLPSTTCNGSNPANGNSSVASTVVNLGAASGTPSGTGAGGFTGSAPAKGSIGLLVTNQASSATGLASALAAAGCTAESMAVLETGTWKIFIVGAPAVVNSAFPGTVAATTAFFVRCAA